MQNACGAKNRSIFIPVITSLKLMELSQGWMCPQSIGQLAFRQHLFDKNAFVRTIMSSDIDGIYGDISGIFMWIENASDASTMPKRQGKHR